MPSHRLTPLPDSIPTASQQPLWLWLMLARTTLKTQDAISSTGDHTRHRHLLDRRPDALHLKNLDMLSSSESADLCLGRWCGAMATEMPFEDLHACDSQHAGAPRNAATNTSTRRHNQAYQPGVDWQDPCDAHASHERTPMECSIVATAGIANPWPASPPMACDCQPL